MDYREHIQKAIEYIENNLPYNINLAACAKVCGYSEYHFLRVFWETVRLTPVDYIRKRRISEIVRVMITKNRYISDIAFEYGFNSKENFVRAFKAEHHILPTEFRKAGNSLKLYDKVCLNPTPFHAEAQLAMLDGFELAAYKSDESDTPNFWNKYNAKQWSKKLSGGNVVRDYGAFRWNAEEKKLDYFCGILKTEARGDLSGTVTLLVPDGLYAIFETPPSTHFDFVNTIHRTWDYIGRVWLPQSGFHRTGGIELESYIEESRTFSETIYIPIMEK